MKEGWSASNYSLMAIADTPFLIASTSLRLFNVKPVIKECDLLVLDDAHGAEQHVARDMDRRGGKLDDAVQLAAQRRDRKRGVGILEPAVTSFTFS